MNVRMPVRRRITSALMAMLAMVLLLATSSACSIMNKKSDQESEVQEPATIRVENQAFLDMNVYVYRSGQRMRLGTVNGNSTQKFRLPSNLIFGSTPLRFQADPIGGNRQPVSQEITVSPGDEVVLTIPPG